MPNASAPPPPSSRLHRLRDAATPFVTRTFRGNRLRRYLAGSVLLGVLSVLLGLWVSFGRGDFEQDMRRSLDLEQGRWDRERVEFVSIADDPFVLRMLHDEREHLRQGELHEYSTMFSMQEQAYATLFTAIAQPVPPQHRALELEVRGLLQRHPPDLDDPAWHYGEDMRDWEFSWHNPASRQRLRAIVDAELLPGIELYSSPLTMSDGVRVIGAVAGGFVVLLMLVVAPLSAGATLAQEVHENTLQPVLGTRLHPADIVLGLASSGLALGGLLAAPSLLVMGLAALAGHSVVALGSFLILLVATSGFAVMLTLLAGFGLGKRWSSGIVSTLLTALLCTAMLTAIGIGMNLDDELAGFIAMLPQAGMVHALRELFVPDEHLSVLASARATLVSAGASIGFAVLAVVIARALTRRIEGRTQASLTRVEAFIAAAAVTLHAVAVLPDYDNTNAIPAYFVSLGLAALPWQLILGGRVPVGDGPAAMRAIPLRGIMLELLGFVALHAAVLVAVFGPDHVPLSFFGGLHLLWALAVLGLLAVRLVALPTGIVGGLFAMLSFGAIYFELGMAALFAAAADPTDPYRPSVPSVFVLFEASAVLGLLQLALTVAIPVVLVRTLKQGSARLR